MKASELMIGDLVYYSHTEDGIAPYKEVVCIKAEDLCCDACIIETHYEPIPLTPEILEENGFETKDNAHYYSAGKIIELLLDEHPFVGYSIHWVKTIETINPIGQQCFIDYYIANLDYVHQLQNALQLCGIEKEIVL